MSDIKLACDVAEQIKTICDKHGNNPGELINILHEAQHLQGYLPEEIQRIIASKLGIPVSKVYGVVTFYTFFTMTPKGKHPISVCMGTACYVRGSEKLLEEFKRVLGIEVGETTPDGKFSLDCLRCLNKGTVDIKEIVAYFEYVFDIDLGDFYHTYMELKAKTKDRTGFLSTLKDRLLLRMREQD